MQRSLWRLCRRISNFYFSILTPRNINWQLKKTHLMIKLCHFANYLVTIDQGLLKLYCLMNFWHLLLKKYHNKPCVLPKPINFKTIKKKNYQFKSLIYFYKNQPKTILMLWVFVKVWKASTIMLNWTKRKIKDK